VLGLLVVAVIAVVAALSVRPEQIENRTLTAEIPARDNVEGGISGHVILEIREAEFHLEPAEPGEPLRVEARFDDNAFALDEHFDPGTSGDGAWTYRVTFGKGDRPGAFSGLVPLVRGSTARIDVFVPMGVPIDLDLDVKEGSAVVRLGGLWLRDAEIDFGVGAFELSVDEPLHEPMEHLSIRSELGGALLNYLGNASPRRLDVKYSTGGIDMSLHGKWLRDAEVNINGGMGGGVVHLPSGVITEGLGREQDAPSGDGDLSIPVLRFSVSSGLGRLEFSP